MLGSIVSGIEPCPLCRATLRPIRAAWRHFQHSAAARRRARWTLSFEVRALPWRPRVIWTGTTEYTMAPAPAGDARVRQLTPHFDRAPTSARPPTCSPYPARANACMNQAVAAGAARSAAAPSPRRQPPPPPSHPTPPSPASGPAGGDAHGHVGLRLQPGAFRRRRRRRRRRPLRPHHPMPCRARRARARTAGNPGRAGGPGRQEPVSLEALADAVLRAGIFGPAAVPDRVPGLPDVRTPSAPPSPVS